MFAKFSAGVVAAKELLDSPTASTAAPTATLKVLSLTSRLLRKTRTHSRRQAKALISSLTVSGQLPGAPGGTYLLRHSKLRPRPEADHFRSTEGIVGPATSFCTTTLDRTPPSSRGCWPDRVQGQRRREGSETADGGDSAVVRETALDCT